MRTIAGCAALVVAAMLVAGAGGSRATRAQGTIAEVDATAQQLVLQVGSEELTVQVTPTTVITMKGVPIAFADLKVGMTVMVCGVVDDGILYADKVNVKYLGK